MERMQEFNAIVAKTKVQKKTHDCAGSGHAALLGKIVEYDGEIRGPKTNMQSVAHLEQRMNEITEEVQMFFAESKNAADRYTAGVQEVVKRKFYEAQFALECAKRKHMQQCYNPALEEEYGIQRYGDDEINIPQRLRDPQILENMRRTDCKFLSVKKKLQSIGEIHYQIVEHLISQNNRIESLITNTDSARHEMLVSKKFIKKGEETSVFTKKLLCMFVAMLTCMLVVLDAAYK